MQFTKLSITSVYASVYAYTMHDNIASFKLLVSRGLAWPGQFFTECYSQWRF